MAASHHAGTKEAVEYVSSPNAALRAGKVILQTSTGINNLFFSCSLQQEQECLVIARPKHRAFLKSSLAKKLFCFQGAFVTDVVDTLHSVSLAIQSPNYSPGHIIGTLKSTMVYG